MKSISTELVVCAIGIVALAICVSCRIPKELENGMHFTISQWPISMLATNNESAAGAGPLLSCVAEFYLRRGRWPVSYGDFHSFTRTNQCIRDLSLYKDLHFQDRPTNGITIHYQYFQWPVVIDLDAP
jgi:hypothetical protein